MSATDEELRFVDTELEMDHVTYILIMFRCVRPESYCLFLLSPFVLAWASLSIPLLLQIFVHGQRVAATPLALQNLKAPSSLHPQTSGTRPFPPASPKLKPMLSAMTTE